jgi:hypothetical protein
MRYTNHPLEREAVKHQISRLALLRATVVAWRNVLGANPTPMQLAIKIAHWAGETGWFREGLWCNNLNNSKRKPDRGPHCYYKCGEVENGVTVYYSPPEIESCFGAFDSIDRGAEDAIAFLALDTTPLNGKPNRYQAAWDALMREDVRAFCHELGLAVFYTADPDHYRRLVEGCLKLLLDSNDFRVVADQLAEMGEPGPPLVEPPEHHHSPSTTDDIARAWGNIWIGDPVMGLPDDLYDELAEQKRKDIADK